MILISSNEENSSWWRKKNNNNNSNKIRYILRNIFTVGYLVPYMRYRYICRNTFGFDWSINRSLIDFHLALISPGHGIVVLDSMSVSTRISTILFTKQHLRKVSSLDCIPSIYLAISREISTTFVLQFRIHRIF